MSEIFLKIVNMSISAGWLVMAVLALRLVLKKAPRWVHVLLWGIVAVRLICPISIESALSLIPSAETISPDIMMDPTPTVTTGIPALNSALNPVISGSFAPNPGDSANPLQIWIPAMCVVWAAGAAAMVAYALISYLRLKKRVSTAFPIGKNIRQSEFVDSPFVLGLIRPVVYLPFRMDSADMEPVIAHELTHIRRKDHWWKPLGYALLAVHWFNPLMWVAYILLCRDIELACDEKVIAELDNESRANYTQALVACSVNRRAIAACPLAFGEVGVKERVKSIMNYRKPGFWVIVLAVVLCVILAVSMLTDPVPETTPAEIFATLEPGDVQWAQATIWNFPAGDHFMLSSEQIKEFVSILNSLEARDFEKNQGGYRASVMINCGDREILLHVSHEEVYFSFDEETAEFLGNTSWSIRSESLNEFLYGVVERHSLLDVTKWISTIAGIDESEATHPAFPGIVFRWTEAEITADGETLIQGMPIWNAYFTDLTGDGKPEICATVSFGSGLIDTHVVVYDYVNRQEYTLSDRGYYDFALQLEEDTLYWNQYSYAGGGAMNPDSRVGFGELELVEVNGIIAVDRQYVAPACAKWVVNVEDRSVTEQIPTDEAIEVFYENYEYTYSFPSIRSHLVIVTYSDGSTEDIKAALNGGIMEVKDLNRFGIQYYVEPKEDDPQ